MWRFVCALRGLQWSGGEIPACRAEGLGSIPNSRWGCVWRTTSVVTPVGGTLLHLCSFVYLSELNRFISVYLQFSHIGLKTVELVSLK